MVEHAVAGLRKSTDAATLDLPLAVEDNKKLLAALQNLRSQNDQALKACNDASHEVQVLKMPAVPDCVGLPQHHIKPARSYPRPV